MRLVSLTIKNFRCYSNEIKIDFENLTTFIGKNDIGKSSILEAMEIFFNNDSVKIEQGDCNIYSTDKKIEITCEFEDLPTKITLDSTSETTLKNEYLLTSLERLKIKKVYDCSKSTPSCEVFIIANHPTITNGNNLLELKEKELQAIIKERKLDSTLKGNPLMRNAIWNSFNDLSINEVEIPVSKPKEDSKKIWEQIESYLPIFALFQSDRNSQDKDKEVQNPMKYAIQTAISEVQEDIERIHQKVREKAEEITNNTYEALKTIDPKLAQQLKSEIAIPTISKLSGLFSVNMETDDGIPLNKRGSGIRRMILVSFFKAEAERRLKSSNKRSIIYALEEPETAQHPNNQKILIDSFKLLSEEYGCQVILTTHSPGLASELPIDGIRFINRNATSQPVIDSGVDVFEEVAKTLGLTPDSRVKVLVCVEGPTDVQALKCLSKAMHIEDNTILNLEDNPNIAFVLMGGSTLKYWVNERYLKGTKYPEIHIYDSDVPNYANYVSTINEREDGSYGFLTKKYEIESYLHPDAIKEAFSVDIDVFDHPSNENKAVPRAFAEAYSPLILQNNDIIKDGKAKLWLSERAFPKMTATMIKERAAFDEIKEWLEKISSLLSDNQV